MPTWDEFMVPLLQLLSDGEVRALRELRDGTAERVGLTDEQLAEVLSTGEVKAYNRIAWAASYLTRVGALTRPARGSYQIADLGRELLESHPTGLTEADLKPLAREGDEWWLPKPSSKVVTPTVAPPATLGPEEQIAEGIARIEQVVSADLLLRLHAQSPAFFEDAVLGLIVAMGYGGAEGRATRTQLSNDGGIDGIVDQDALGLSRIYLQAKRYAPETSVDRPAIQAFVGALHGAQANQGVFITTARFSAGARAYADAVPTRVVLIDGQRLTALMIRYGVGVQVKQIVRIVEIDEDFFE